MYVNVRCASGIETFVGSRIGEIAEFFCHMSARLRIEFLNLQ